LNPDELSARSIVLCNFATGRFARTCKAIASGDTGGLAATTFCAKMVEGKKLLIIVALARMKSFVEEQMRERRAITSRSFPQGDDPRNAGTMVGLLFVMGCTARCQVSTSTPGRVSIGSIRPAFSYMT
jgi:hypothetical protein